MPSAGPCRTCATYSGTRWGTSVPPKLSPGYRLPIKDCARITADMYAPGATEPGARMRDPQVVYDTCADLVKRLRYGARRRARYHRLRFELRSLMAAAQAQGARRRSGR